MSTLNPIHFEISERKILLRFIDIVVVIATLHIVGALFEIDYFQVHMNNWLHSALLGFYLFFFANVFELYDLKKASRIKSTLSGVSYTASLTALAYLLTPYFTPALPDNRIKILYFFITIMASLLAWRAVYIKLFASSLFYKKIIIIADALDAVEIAENLQEADPNYRIEGYISTDFKAKNIYDGSIKALDMNEVLDKLESNKVSEIVIASTNVENITPVLYSWLIELVENGYSVREYTQVYEEMTDRVPVTFVGKDFYRYFPFARSNQNQLYRVYHRTFDILVSIVGLALGMMVLPIILLGNLIANRGPLFYSQVRVGRNRKEFHILKYRTMRVDAEAAGAQFTVKSDVRITSFGKFLRKTRLDEFPQFINILKGEMSVIGPRPERPIFVKELNEKIPFYETRHIVKPGLTGWAQVKAGYGESYEDHLKKLQYDLFYIKKRSIFLDLRILVKTLSTVIYFKGQ